jgi:hypothetical protein
MGNSELFGDVALLGLGIYAIDKYEKRKKNKRKHIVRKHTQKRKTSKKKDDLFPKWSDIK